MITEIDGVLVGHWTDQDARTGCTVIRFPDGTVASGEVRGGAPATREFALLAPDKTVKRIDAVVLCGGSAFGLAAATGVMEHCAELGVGFPTDAGPVPIVVAMALFDLLEGDGTVRPTAADGYAASLAAGDGPVPTGRVGAGTGARVDKWLGRDRSVAGGIGAALLHDGPLAVGALVAVNAAGGIDDGTAASGVRSGAVSPRHPEPPFGNTTIGVVVTNGRLDKIGCLHLAQAGHDGLARAVFPPHLPSDGDALVGAATGAVDAPIEAVRALGALVVEDAVRSAVG